MYKVLLALDGSFIDEAALDYGKLLARAAAGQMVLIQVMPQGYVAACCSHPEGIASSPVAARLDALAQRLRDTGLPVESHVYAGDGDCAVCHETRVQHPDLVVMPAGGQAVANSSRSAIEQILRLVAAPVLLVPAGCRIPRPGESLGPILVPLDGSRAAEQALGSAAEVARLLGIELLLQQTLEPPWAADGAQPADCLDFEADDLLADIRDYLTGTASRLAKGNVAARVQLDVGLPARVLDNAVRVQHAFAIAVSSASVPASTAAELMQRSAVPLLMCPSAEARVQGGLTSAAVRIPSSWNV